MNITKNDNKETSTLLKLIKISDNYISFPQQLEYSKKKIIISTIKKKFGLHKMV
jgi:hypothetical protein